MYEDLDAVISLTDEEAVALTEDDFGPFWPALTGADLDEAEGDEEGFDFDSFRPRWWRGERLGR